MNTKEGNKTMYNKVARELMSRTDLYEGVNLIKNAKVLRIEEI